MPDSEHKIEGHTLTHLLEVADKNVIKKTQNSTILDPEAEERIPKFDVDELKLGRVLGRGGFCVVHEVVKIALREEKAQEADNDSQAKKVGNDEDGEHTFHTIVQDRSFMQANCLRGVGKDCRYALKKLQPTKDAQTYVNGVVDLAVEARFLAVIRHPNIIKMRAMMNGGPTCGHFFVVLDRLYDIMGTRISKWRRRQPRGLGKMFDRKGKRQMAFWLERVTVAYDLACALKFLHDGNVLYRDTKPDNIGFDVRDDVKIFDFGLAREFDPEHSDKDGNYNFTGDTGSPRYMATEVALGQPYNEKCDVYSFAVLLWQILAMETPYEGYTMGMFERKVTKGGARPSPSSKWPEPIVTIMRRGWGPLKDRPSMEEVCEVLRDEVNKNADEEINEIMDASRKSEMSLHKI